MFNLFFWSGPIPYRNNKLTRFLADSLGGNSRTLFIVNLHMSPGYYFLFFFCLRSFVSFIVIDFRRLAHYHETLMSCMYAQRAKRIKNLVQKNKRQSILFVIIANWKCCRLWGMTISTQISRSCKRCNRNSTHFDSLLSTGMSSHSSFNILINNLFLKSNSNREYQRLNVTEIYNFCLISDYFF